MTEIGGAPPQRFTATLLRELAAQPDVVHTLQGVVELAVETIPGCEQAGVSVRQGRKLTTRASTAAVVDEADQVQYDLWQGPCVDSVWVDDTYLVDDMSEETRWPDWAPAAHRLGLRSSLSVRLATPKEIVGSLNMYGAHPRAFDEDDVVIAHTFADHAAHALVVAQEVTTLRTALQSRHRIGVAQGILRRRYGMTLDQSFTLLVRVSRDNNVRLRDLADMVVEDNGLPSRFVEE